MNSTDTKFIVKSFRWSAPVRVEIFKVKQNGKQFRYPIFEAQGQEAETLIASQERMQAKIKELIAQGA